MQTCLAWWLAEEHRTAKPPLVSSVCQHRRREQRRSSIRTSVKKEIKPIGDIRSACYLAEPYFDLLAQFP